MGLGDALRSAELDDAGVHASYPRGTREELGVRLYTPGTARGASSDAASSERSSSTYGHGLPFHIPESKTLVGGVPITDHEALVSDRGVDPITDHASFGVNVWMSMAATCPPYRPGRLATATAISVPDSPALNPVSVEFPVSRAVDPDYPDGFTISRHAEIRDGLPCTASFQGCEHF